MSHRIGLPSQQGLYDSANEHDACGVGFVANIKGRKSHGIIKQGIDILCNLTHRGAVGADPLDGDGAGLLIQMPDGFFRATLNEELPPLGEYATGLIFMPNDRNAREACRVAVNESLEAMGLDLIGWRDVPTDSSSIGSVARSVEPAVRQVFVGLGNVDKKLFELKLYLARKMAENRVRNQELNGGEYFYILSLSSRTILYKGMLLSDQLSTYFPELADERMVSALAFVHQRYSTNTFPTWDLAQPFRFIAHNGEINTMRGNVSRMRAREALFNHPDLSKDEIEALRPVIADPDGSDTAAFDNAFEMLVQTGRSLTHAMAMMVPEAWATKAHLPRALKGFFEYHATMMEPWDGPANLVACDGRQIVAALDRNGLRPARYWITDDDDIVYASEAGVLDIPSHKIVSKRRLAPGKMILVDTVRGSFHEDGEIKEKLASEHPYAEWVSDNLINLRDLPSPVSKQAPTHQALRQEQQVFGYTLEEMRMILAPMAKDGQEPVGSMGADTPLAVLSSKSKLLYWYFKQLFAQVTNPPIDPLREEIVMSLTQYIGPALNILHTGPEHCRMVEIDQPVLTNDQLQQLKHADLEGFRGTKLDMTFPADQGPGALKKSIDRLLADGVRAVENDYTILVLSDRGVNEKRAPIPALLAISALHHHLIKEGKRSQCSLIIESAEPREVHHFACLLGYGATAVNPYLAFETIADMVTEGLLPTADGNTHADDEEDFVKQYAKSYIKAIGKGLYKIFSKMGISTLQSYAAAQIFEAVGLSDSVVDRYFTGTNSKIGGADLDVLARETLMRHEIAYAPITDKTRDIDRGGEYMWRREGEYHLMNPETIALLQHGCFSGNYKTFKRYSKMVDDQAKHLCTLRGLFNIESDRQPIPIDEVEPVESITRRFCTGAMSLGSISPEAHETLAIAMNRIGGKSNTGEGGEDPARFLDERRSKIKQVASGRFGVTPHYLVNADELQIKVAQGAKPGEGGQLPGHKVSDYIGWLRYSVPGVTLISPPPHHDIYSIEDLAQLIYDLKNVNPEADVTVKLVSVSGVGTVAAGVAKGKAETVIIAGYDGGTGASPMSSIKHTGLPWEIGLAETQQTLVLNDLRGRIRVQTDGQMRTGRDVIIASMLGAEEYGFATVALMVEGCIMMRKCHLNTCPVGIATQDENLRKKFPGKPEYVVNYFTFIAQEIREYLAEFGYRSLDELIGRTDLLHTNEAIKHWKSKGLDFSKLFHLPEASEGFARRNIHGQDHELDHVLDRKLIAESQPALERGEPVHITSRIRNSDRTTGAMLAGNIAKRYGNEGLPDATISIDFEGIAGQSFGTFCTAGMQLRLHGEANDYVGKGMAGGRLIIRPPEDAPFRWSENSVVGNTVLYGATGGECYFAGRAGERFCVRNSGVTAVIEGVGDHGCEYMTGGLMICLGRTGRNFGAGMSGGIAFVLDEDARFNQRCNHGMVDLELVELDEDIETLRKHVERHAELTDSHKAQLVLDHWEDVLPKFVKVFPHEYRRVLNERAAAKDAAAVG